MKKNIEIKLEPGYSLLAFDLFFRVLILLMGLFFLELDKWIFPFCNLLVLVFTLYIAHRRSRGLTEFLRMRSITYPEFQKSHDHFNDPSKFSVSITTTSISDNAMYFMIVVLLSTITGFSNIASTISKINPHISLDSVKHTDIFVTVTFIISIGMTIFAFLYFKHLFVSRKLVDIVDHTDTKNLKKLNKLKFVKHLNSRRSLNEDYLRLSMLNDGLINELEKRIDIYKHKLETFFFESVFLGALTFATFTQISSPESIETIMDWEEAKTTELTSESKESKPTYESRFEVFKMEVAEIFSIDSWIKDYNENKDLSIPKAFIIISIGSLICSVFYVTILIKRFPIIQTIENVSSKVRNAKRWNEREEDLIAKLDKMEEKGFGSLSRTDILKQRRLEITEQIQIEIASCHEMLVGLGSNLRLIGIIRQIGLYTFFGVLFVAAELINHNLFIILLVISLYAIIAVIILHGVRLFPRREKELFKDDYNFKKYSLSKW